MKSIKKIEAGRLEGVGLYDIIPNKINVANPKGGRAFFRNVVTGAIKITLPKRATQTEVRFIVDINHLTDNAAASVIIGGYNNTAWAATTVQIISTLNQDFKVRFGNDGTNDCVWLDEVNKVWSNLDVSVRDFSGGRTEYNSGWAKGWSISLATAFGTVDVVKENNYPYSDANKLKNLTNVARNYLTLTATDPTHAVNLGQADGRYDKKRTRKEVPNTTQYTLVAEDFTDHILYFTANAGEEISVIVNAGVAPENGQVQLISEGDNILIPAGGTGITLTPPVGTNLRGIGKGGWIGIIHAGSDVFAVNGNLVGASGYFADARLSNIVSDLSEAEKTAIKNKLGVTDGGGSGTVISSIISVTQNYLLTTASNNAILRVKDYASIIIPSGLGLKHRTVIKKATGKTVSLTAGENVVLETPSGYIAQVLAENDAIEIVLEEIDGTIEYWGVYGALKTGDKDVAFTAEETSVNTSLLWPFAWKSSDFPMITTTKEYFTIYSTDHDIGDGAIYWGEMDDPEFTNFIERGLIKSGYQAESPWPVNKGGVLYLFYHTINEPGNGVGDGSTSIQETRLMTTTGGELHTATWVDKGRPLGLQSDENHTGYLRCWLRGDGTYIGHHLKVGGEGGQAGYSTSTDLENWTRSGVMDITSGMPVGSVYSRFSIIPYTYNDVLYGFVYHTNSLGENYIGVTELDANYLPSNYLKDLHKIDNLYGIAGYVNNDIGYILYESGAAADNTSVFYLFKYYLPHTV